MAFQSLNSLETALMNAAADPVMRPVFIRQFIDADIFVPQEKSPAVEGQTVLPAGSQLQVQPFEFEGRDYMPVFSSLPRLESDIQRESGYITIKARIFLTITRGKNAWLNSSIRLGTKNLTR